MRFFVGKVCFPPDREKPEPIFVLMESKPGSKPLFLSTSYPKTGLILSLSKDPLFAEVL